MTHYICTGGCNGISDKPGTCQAVDCPNYNEPLETCECADGKHEGLIDHDVPPAEEE